jgi:uncharacterized protein YciI
MPDYLLIYDYAPDALERRGPLRREHLGLAWQAVDRGQLVLAGAFGSPVDGAVLHFRCETPAPIEAFVRADPYVRNGLVTAWKIREWTTVAGSAALKPLRPEDV